MESTHVRDTCSRPTNADEDGAVVLVARAGREGFGQLYDRYSVQVFRYLRRRTTTPEDAADLTQQVFLRALSGLPQYRREVPFRSWLFRIARNAATDAERRRREATPWESIPEADQSASRDDPEASALRHESLARLAELLRHLDADKRELIRLRFAAGLTAAQIGTLVGKREKAVQRQINRILHALRERYGER